MKDEKALKNVIKEINSSKKYPAIDLVKSNPEAAAFISKLINSKHLTSSADINKKETYYNIDNSQIENISEGVINKIKDNENIIELFPDIELAIQILISSILSPKDMMKTEIIYSIKDNILPSELSMKLNNIVKTHIEGYYDIKDELQPMLRESLFTTGSYIKAILPESIVDEVINSNNISTESISEIIDIDNKVVSLGILGNPSPKKEIFSLESFNFSTNKNDYNPKLFIENTPIKKNEGLNKNIDLIDSNLEISDNYKLLKLPLVYDSLRQKKIKSVIRPQVATENIKLSNVQINNLLYKNQQANTETFIVLPTPDNAKRKSVGRPLILKLPSESVIPIFTPGDETKHIGYFVVVDIDGNPVTSNSNRNYLSGLSSLNSRSSGCDGLAGSLINKARANLGSSNCAVTLDQMTSIYTSIVEKDLLARLKNGIYKNELDIGNNEEVYRIMLARSLSNKFTRLIYVPSELVTYFAFKYFENGLGRSFLDDIKTLCSLRAVMLFAKTMAMVKNSISLTHVNMKIDPDDPDPRKTIEMAIHEITKMRQTYFPVGINSPTDLVDWIQRVGLEFTFEGHPEIPDTKFEFETKSMQHALPDNDLDEMLRKQTYMSLGLSPETVDNGFNSEFATTVVANNILLSKRVSQSQETFTRKLTDYIKKVCSNDSIITDELIEAVKANEKTLEKWLTDDEKEFFKNDKNSFYVVMVERFIDNIKIDLPKPDTTSMENLTTSFDHYAEALDKTLEFWISSNIITSDVGGDLSNNIESIKSIIKGYFIRNWMAENGYMSELNDIITSDEDGSPNLDIFDISESHLEGLMLNCTKFLEAMKKTREDSNDKISKLDIGESNIEPNSGSDYNDDSGSDLNLDETGNEEETSNTDENASTDKTNEEDTGDLSDDLEDIKL